jgi:LmbE family N-acetylglucosaminyl deacetylase
MSSRAKRGICIFIVAVLLAPRLLGAQERGATALGDAILGIGVNTRVLMIGAHPDDEDTFLIAWLSRGRHVSTAYLSLTRGDGGQNLIGNELGEALGVIRTEELLAARRIDGADQYFTRAFDFGFSKDTVDTFEHWPRDSILGDVIRVVRSFRPHVIVAVFSGTTRDGHGQHQVSGLLAREAYDVSGDTVRFPVSKYGGPWTTSKFYRAARGNSQAGTLGVDVGEYSPLLGRSYAEIAGHSLSQHKSQGFGVLQRKGPVMNYVRREATRVNESIPATSEVSLFDGIDTTWARFRTAAGPPAALVDSLPLAFAAVRAAFEPFAPQKLIPSLTRALRIVQAFGARQLSINADLAQSIQNARIRITNALRLTSGVSIEANSFELFPLDSLTPLFVSIYNRGRDTVAVSGGMTSGLRPSASITRALAPGGVLRDTLVMRVDSLSQPWWLAKGRDRGMFVLPGSVIAENARGLYPGVGYSVDLGGPHMGQIVGFVAPVTLRYVDDIRGEVEHNSEGAPAILVSIDEVKQYARAGIPIDREVVVRVRSVDWNPRGIRVTLTLPSGLSADTTTRSVRVEKHGDERAIPFRLRGHLSAGVHNIVAVASSGGESFRLGSQLIDYDHIRRQRIYRPAEVTISAVDVRVPSNLKVAYLAGVGDNVAPALTQLGIPVTVVPASELARASLAGYTTVVIGPRAYDANPELVAANARVLEFARRGGTVVVQYGQYEMTQPDIMPYPITIARPHDRVTHEDAPVTFLEPRARLLTTPNRITAADFEGWVQERSLYMPRTFDERYRPLLSMTDPGEPMKQGGILVAPIGSGLYIYTTLAFFRQLPAGVPGAARLFVNLLSAGIDSSRPKP